MIFQNLMIAIGIFLSNGDNIVVENGAIVYTVSDQVIEARQESGRNYYLKGAIKYDPATGQAAIMGDKSDIIYRDSFRDYGEFRHHENE